MAGRTARRVLSEAAALFDRAATLAAYASTATARRRSTAESLGHDERIRALAALTELYRSRREPFFREPRPIRPFLREVRRLRRGGTVEDLSWRSGYETFLAEVADRYDRPENEVAACRLFRLGGSRPVVICVHGYMGGHYRVEERMWPIRWLMKIGLDVVLFVLPFHGVRGDPHRRRPPPFPGPDPRITNEGFRQAMADLRDLVGWLHERGHPSVSIMGMSLGGYTAALAATVEPGWSLVVPMIPLASIADFARDQGRLGSTPEQTAAQHEALERVYDLVSPLARRPVVAHDRVLVVGARADRITPAGHARRLAAHFDAQLELWHGGHLLQFGRGEVFRLVGRRLNALGVLTESRGLPNQPDTG